MRLLILVFVSRDDFIKEIYNTDDRVFKFPVIEADRPQ